MYLFPLIITNIEYYYFSKDICQSGQNLFLQRSLIINEVKFIFACDFGNCIFSSENYLLVKNYFYNSWAMYPFVTI